MSNFLGRIGGSVRWFPSFLFMTWRMINEGWRYEVTGWKPQAWCIDSRTLLFLCSWYRFRASSHSHPPAICLFFAWTCHRLFQGRNLKHLPISVLVTCIQFASKGAKSLILPTVWVETPWFFPQLRCLSDLVKGDQIKGEISHNVIVLNYVSTPFCTRWESTFGLAKPLVYIYLKDPSVRERRYCI